MYVVKPGSATFCVPHLFEEARRHPKFPLKMTRSEYEKGVDGWQFFCIYWGDECLMIISIVAHRIHISALPNSKGRWCRRKVIQTAMDYAFEGKRFLETMIEETNEPAIRVAEKVGFRQINDNMGFRHYFLHREDRKL